jgi:hypothetical protein
MRNTALFALGLTAVAFAALHAPGAAAYPIPPRTLTTQVDAADAVVFATVERVEQLKPDPDADGPRRWVDTVAHLKVARVLRGDLEEKTVQVSYSAGMICPAPARFVEGELVLAFLSKEKLGWMPEGLSYATLYPRPEEIDAFTSAVERAQKLLAKKAGPEEMRAFFVDLAVEPATRWHGLYELERGAFMMSHYDRKPTNARALDEEELHRLTEAFLASPADQTLPMLNVLRDARDPRVDATAVRLAKELFEKGGASWESQQLMKASAARLGFEMPKPSYDENVEPILGDPLLRSLEWDDAKAQRKLLNALVKKVDLAKASEPNLRRIPRVIGVGDTTPP